MTERSGNVKISGVELPIEELHWSFIAHKIRTEYGFLATSGYDPVSGLGTLNIGKIIHHLKTHYNFSKY